MKNMKDKKRKRKNSVQLLHCADSRDLTRRVFPRQSQHASIDDYLRALFEFNDMYSDRDTVIVDKSVAQKVEFQAIAMCAIADNLMKRINAKWLPRAKVVSCG